MPAPHTPPHPLMSGETRGRTSFFFLPAGSWQVLDCADGAAWVWGQALLRRLIDLSCVGWLPLDQGSSRGWLALRSSMGRSHSRMRTSFPLTCDLHTDRCSLQGGLPPS